MHRVPILRRKPLWLATLALCTFAGTASAQQAVQEPVEQGTIDWRKANDEVSQFRRGHADVLKWEQANDAKTKDAPAMAPDLWLKTADAAVRQAWRARPELSTSLSQLGAVNQEHIAQGRWLEVDPAVRRHVDDFYAVLDVAVDTRKAWWKAVSAQAGLKLNRIWKRLRPQQLKWPVVWLAWATGAAWSRPSLSRNWGMSSCKP